MHTHSQSTHVGARECILCTSTHPRFWLMIKAKQNTAVLGSPVCLIPVFLFVDCSRSTHLPHFSSTSFLIAFPFILNILSTVPVRKRWPELEEVVGGVGGKADDRIETDLVQPTASVSPLLPDGKSMCLGFPVWLWPRRLER